MRSAHELARGPGILLALAIGSAFAFAQPNSGQAPAQLMTLEDGGADLLAELERWRAADAGRTGWQRAHDVGPAASAAVWARLRRDRKAELRLFWLGAYAAAAGGRMGERLLDAGWLRGARRQEQVMALLAVGLGPRLDESYEPIAQLVLDSPSPALRIAGCCALACHDIGVDLPEEWFTARGRDNGVWAAAMLAGAMPPAAAIERVFAATDLPGEVEQLLWRALFAARLPSARASAWQRTLAVRVLSWDTAPAARLRSVAAHWLAASGNMADWVAGPPPAELLIALAASPSGRDVLRARGWTEAVPSKRINPLTRRRLAVAHALSASTEQVTEAIPSWLDEPDLLGDIALALAWRATAHDVDAAPWAVACGARPEAAWLRVVTGEVGGEFVGDDVALAMAGAARLPASEVRAAIEDRLWQRDVHPLRGTYLGRMALIRDLLLSGSDHARSQDPLQRAFAYLPEDLQSGDHAFFAVACEFHDWSVENRTSPPEGYRL